MGYVDGHSGWIDFNMAGDSLNQIIFQRIQFCRRQIGAIMDQDQLQTFLGAVSTLLASKKPIA